MARSVLDLSLKKQKKLLDLKKQYGAATTDEERQRISQAGDTLRSEAGIQAGSAGQLSAKDLGSVISQREELAALRSQPPAQTDVGRLQKELSAEQERAQIAGLTRAKEAGLSALRGEEETIAPAYAGARSQTRATSERQAKQFSDFMAARGLTRGGGSALGETQRLGAMQGALGGLREQETAAVGDIARRRADIQGGFATDVEAARAGIQAQSLQNAIAQANADRAFQAQQTQQTFSNEMATRAAELQQAGFDADQAWRQAQIEQQQADAAATASYRASQLAGRQTAEATQNLNPYINAASQLTGQARIDYINNIQGRGLIDATEANQIKGMVGISQGAITPTETGRGALDITDVRGPEQVIAPPQVDITQPQDFDDYIKQQQLLNPQKSDMELLADAIMLGGGLTPPVLPATPPETTGTTTPTKESIYNRYTKGEITKPEYFAELDKYGY